MKVNVMHPMISPIKSQSQLCQWTRRELMVLISIVAVGLALRLVGINSPFLDSMAQRQSQDAMVARHLYYDGMTFWCPRLDIFGNSSGCTVLEFPLVPGLAAAFYYVFGEQALVGRLICVAFWIGTMPFMAHLARQFLSPVAALSAVALYTFSPMNIYFSRAFMGESSLMFFSVATVVLFFEWLKRSRPLLFFGSALCISLALLTKPTAAVLLVPILVAWFMGQGWSMMRRRDFWLYLCIVLLPFVFWFLYANYVNVHNTDMPVVWQRWDAIITKFGSVVSFWVLPRFYLNLAFWIAGVLLTPLGFVGAVAGVWRVPPGSLRVVLYMWLAALVGSTFILAGATYEHSYYHLPLLPVSAILFGYAVEWLYHSHGVRDRFKNKAVRYGVGSAVVFIVLGYGVGFYIFYSYMYDVRLRSPYVMEVATIVRTQTPPEGAVILDQPGDTTQAVTYQLQRQSWDWKLVTQGKSAQAIQDLEKLRARGATTYIAIDTKYGSGMDDLNNNPILWRYLNDTYRPIALSEHYAIFDLR
jgi:hypothetical protein